MNKILKLLKCDISWMPLYKELIWLFILCFACINFSCAWSYTYSWTLNFSNWVSSISTLFRLPVPFSSISYSSTIYLSCDFSFNNFQSSDLTNFAYIWRFSSINLSNFVNSNLVIWNSDILLSSNNYSFSRSINYLNNLVSSFELYRNSASSFLSCSSLDWCSIDYSCTFTWIDIINQSDIWWSCDYSEYEDQINTLSWSLASCQSDLTTCQNTNSCTQLKCENDYNLVPESSINSEYCEDRFDLIDPENCPASWWTWDIQWSSFFVNSRQIQGAWNIYLWLPDFLDWWYTYIDNWQTLEIDVENVWDENYINAILSTQTYHPSSDEFAVSFVWYLTLLMPYIIITLFIIFVWKLIRRIFK